MFGPETYNCTCNSGFTGDGITCTGNERGESREERRRERREGVKERRRGGRGGRKKNLLFAFLCIYFKQI